MGVTILNRRLNQVVEAFLEGEIRNRENALELCTKEVEADQGLQEEMSDWNEALSDGLDNKLSLLRSEEGY